VLEYVLLRDYVIAVVAVLAVVLLLGAAAPFANATTAALCLILVVVLAARSLRGAAALIAALASVVTLNYFFIPPFHTLTVADPHNWVALGVFLAVAVAVGELSLRAKNQTTVANEQRFKAEELYRELQAAFEREAQTEAERRSERLKSALLDAVTHNLRTPITSIKASTTTLLSEGSMADAGRRELLTVANEEADRLDLLVEDLIRLARIEAGDLGLQVAWCNVEDVIATALKRIYRLLRGQRVAIEIPPDLPVVRADARWLEEVLFQLLENAAKYSPADSRITISAAAPSDDIVEIRVDDEGPGVAPAERERVFEKFYRSRATQAMASGSGLGLAIVRGIIEAHRGQTMVTDRPGGQHGARFTVRIPIGDEDTV
jgi:two-component system sensor histidine kinase KdpD